MSIYLSVRIPQPPTPPQRMQYFYDLSLLDVRGEISTAITVLYYGNEIGAFSGPDIKTVDLSRVYAVEIDLTAYANNDNGVHSYSIMFFERKWDEEVWNQKLLQKKHNLRSVTTRVSLTADMTDNPKHEHHIFTASNRYIDFSVYPEIATSHVVPVEYIEQFNQRFVGYLMRSERVFDDVHEMIGKYQLVDLVSQDYEQVNDLHENVKVHAYGMLKKNAIA
ncbi:hypothetical protein BSZ32_08800 [Rubritalea profundi]|uniref:Uncharacterized protein n=2 Tax=Rubritalea profundi TaxID=1658618 RepID=A0A2S7U2C9_9BACT|nr:hypothetical protein BSZ32_08800 [Rubritalea profundi]